MHFSPHVDHVLSRVEHIIHQPRVSYIAIATSQIQMKQTQMKSQGNSYQNGTNETHPQLMEILLSVAAMLANNGSVKDDLE